MPIYEIKADQISRLEETTFGQAGLKERNDLQRLLRTQIDIIAPDVLVIAEEFGDFEDSKRRIDLLGIDKKANLVVIELKRTDDGGHMDLQSLRYAAMVSTMTYERALDEFRNYLANDKILKDAEQELLHFLEWEEPNQEIFAQDVRIVLASAEFSKEITSTVLWLNDYGLDIRCVRMKPYKDNGRTLVDIEQIIPLPEAKEYQIGIATKNQERKAHASTRDFSKNDVSVYGVAKTNLPKRHLMFHVVKTLCDHGVEPGRIAELIDWRSNRMFFVVDGKCSSKEFIKTATGKMGMNGKPFDETRWFHEDDELIFHNGKTYAFSNQWGSRTLEALKILADNFVDANISFKKA
jgi:hypothetical protein